MSATLPTPVISYAGVAQGLYYSPSALLTSPIQEVTVAAASTGGAAPTGTVTFYLNGIFAGRNAIGLFGEGIASFQANPGNYTLTADYSGDQNYSPVDLSATPISIALTATGISGFSGTQVTTSLLPVTETSETSTVTSGGEFKDSFNVAVDNSSPEAQTTVIEASVIAVPVSNPSAGGFTVEQFANNPVTLQANQVNEVPFSVDVQDAGWTPGTYALEYDVSQGSYFSNIVSQNTFVVTAPVVATGTGVQLGKTKGLPVAVVAGTPVRGSSVVTVTNDETTATKGTETVALYATTTGAIDTSSTLLGSVRKSMSLKAGKSGSVTVPIKTLAPTAGTYTVLARVTDAAGVTTDTTTGPAFAVSAPFIQLTGSISKLSRVTVNAGQSLAFTLALSNTGNMDSTGKASLAVALSADRVTSTIPVETLSKSYTVKPGKTVRLRLTIKVPAAAAGMSLFPRIVVYQSGETYFVTATTAVVVG
jgi:hypothetical protein